MHRGCKSSTTTARILGNKKTHEKPTGSPWAIPRPEGETSDRELCKRSESFSGYACLHGMHNNSSGCLLATGVFCTYRGKLYYHVILSPLSVLCLFKSRMGVYLRAINIWTILMPVLRLRSSCVNPNYLINEEIMLLEIIYFKLAIKCFLLISDFFL